MKTLSIILALLFSAGVAVADDYVYVPGEYASEDEIQGTVLTTVAELKTMYFELKAEKKYLQELVQNQIKIRDAAIATGTSINQKVQAISAEMTILRNAYLAWVEAANIIPSPVE